MKIKTLYVICFILIFGCNTGLQQIPPANEIIQVALDIPQLQQYYHIKELPERRPLIVSRENLPETAKATKFGESVIFLSQVEIQNRGIKAFIRFTRFIIREKSAEISLEYSIEGIYVNAEMVLTNNHWSVSESTLREK